MLSIDAGSALIVEATFNSYTPFSGYALADPTSLPTVTVTNKKGTEVISAQSMTKAETGKYWFRIQSLATWLKGAYKVQIDSAHASSNDIKVSVNNFSLE